MNRILVSPKAVTLAAALSELTRDPGENQVEYSLQRVAPGNAALMAAAGLTRSTLFRALVELGEAR